MTEIERLRREAEEARRMVTAIVGPIWPATVDDLNRALTAYGDKREALGRAEGAAEERERWAKVFAEVAKREYDRGNMENAGSLFACVEKLRSLSPAAPDRREEK